MSDKKTTGNWLNLPLEELDKRMPKETPRMKGQKIWEKVKKVLDFLGFINSSTPKGGRSSGYGGNVHVNHNQPSTPTFRESQHFDPERAYIQRMQEVAYNQMVDGRGDPEHCDCDHDER